MLVREKLQTGELFVSNIPQMDNPDINNKELQPQRPGHAQLRNTHKIHFFNVKATLVDFTNKLSLAIKNGMV